MLDKEKMLKLFHGQARSADLWIGQWRRYKDVSSVRNASLAIGKMAGIYHVMVSSMEGAGETVPEDIIQKMGEYHAVWDDLHISKEVAKTVSIHG